MLDAQQLMWTQIAAGISVLLFGLMLFNLVRMRGRMQAARSWDKVEGIITISRVDQPATHASDDRNDAKPVIRYRYQAGGQELESDKVFVGGPAITTRVLAAKLIGRYPVGAHVDVHVDPKQPTEALLEPAAAQNVAALVAFTIVFGFIATTLTAHSLAGHVLYTNNGVPLFAFALPIIVLVGGVFCVAEYVRTRRLASASLRWPTAAGRVTRCDVIEEIIEEKSDDDDKSRSSKLQHRYQVDLRYAYRVDKRDFIGTEVDWGGTMISVLREVAEKAAAKYRPGQNVKVYYDPERPGHAVLEPASREGALGPLIGAAVCAVVGGLFLTILIKVGFA
ncbi:hypothetical protein WN73_07530 [Bradyrhizobium sp. CCBAU 45394]|uniref:DUF3592 domain-containing protein n=1 Tax=unclassified Bradyrhizobium TaxID=2631580 RepID=UPI00230481D0|nr:MULTISPECIES: DUF3592 domain-containing protein [unclassified Bradyrhizobium]MDA9390542.1 hypothetical protein [Bradyrhizobium sp. CCBAU 45394]MDA9541227.1 hypothetical protein [Bradyrhizobium sp. CCBAU 21362]